MASFPATVGLMEPIGSDTFVELDVGAATIVARVEPDLPIAHGPVGRRPSCDRRGSTSSTRRRGERIVA